MSRPLAFATAALIGLSACAPTASEAGDADLVLAQLEPCAMMIDFSDPETVSDWRIVDDGVMGGRSQGTRFHEDGAMVFRGTINTNGGGFSSLRYPMPPGPLAGANGLTLSVKSDGRAYKMTFRTSERFRGRSVSYQAPIPATRPDEWTKVTVPFADMETSVFGFSVPAEPFDPSDVREMGIILADGVDGAFRLEVASLSCTAEAVQPA